MSAALVTLAFVLAALFIGFLVVAFYTMGAFRWWLHDSETLLFARAQSLVGVVFGGAAAMNWGPIVSLAHSAGFSRNQAFWLFCVLFAQGLVTEIARRYRDKDM